MLFFNVVQDLPNAFGPSPLGSCSDPKKTTDDPNCPDLARHESYYACPAAGCPHYVVLLNDSTYQPGRSTCQPYETYAQNPPLNQNVLVLKDDATNRAIEHVEVVTSAGTSTQAAPSAPVLTGTSVPENQPHLAPGTYRVAITYVFLGGGETVLSTESTICLGAGCAPKNTFNAFIVASPIASDYGDRLQRLRHCG